MEAVDLLKCHNLKKTIPRLAIVNVLLDATVPLSEAEIKTKIGETYDRITFYRSMHSLKEVGLIHKIVVDSTMIKYALNNCSDGHVHDVDHIHFYCKKCGRVNCLNDVKISSYALPDGFLTNECDVLIKGTCNACKI